LRLLRQHAGDISLVMRLNAQYASMIRTSLSVLGRLMRVQALRQKREAIEGAANQDAWTLHIAEQSMAKVVDQDAKPPQAAPPKATPVTAPVTAPVPTRVEAPAARVDQLVADNPSKNETNSPGAAFETWLSAQLNHATKGLGATDLRESMAKPGLAGRQPPADGGKSSRRANGHDNGGRA
jgi:hypothetical protein